MRVLYVASEVRPYAKTGGLADVAHSLPKALAELGLDVRVAMPKYREVATVASAEIPVAGREAHGHLETILPDHDPKMLFVCNDEFFDREGLYGHPDDAARFIFFCRALLELLRQTKWRPDIIHCNDWQTGLIPTYLKTIYANDPFYRKTATVFTIHNLAYQGCFPPETIQDAGLSWALFNSEELEFYGQVNLLKAGLVFADLLTTVSKQYAREIQTPQFGERLEGVLLSRAEDLYGVLNGLDYDFWNPQTDEFLKFPYGPETLEEKERNVAALREELKLPPSSGPLFGMVSRLSAQKGLGLLPDAVEEVVRAGGQLVLLGTGDDYFMKLARRLQRRFREHVRCVLRFDEPLAHRIYAGSHFFLMPSLYEPCGLGQMIALRYAAIPIVRATGGLKDTITDADASRSGNGFVFEQPTGAAFADALRRAARCFADPPRYRALQLRGMSCDFSWARSAREYLKLYRKALRKRRAQLAPARTEET